MSNDAQIAKILDDLRRENYKQVSISELAHRVGLPAREVATHLRTIRAKTIILRGEKYVMLDFRLAQDNAARLAPKAFYSDLEKPKSAILSDL